MIPWQKLDETTMPGGGKLTLMQRGSEFSIMSGTIGLMNSRMSGSEEQLAMLSAARVGKRPKARILIGVPAVIAWARGPLFPIHGDSLDDPRVTIHEGDVRTAISDRKPFDAILLDVDNGPDGLFRPENDRLYSANGLSNAKSALTRGGHLAVWSAYPDAAFTKRLSQSGMAIEEVRVRERSNGKGARHLIWFATKAGSNMPPPIPYLA
jgi:hypothetical protein